MVNYFGLVLVPGILFWELKHMVTNFCDLRFPQNVFSKHVPKMIMHSLFWQKLPEVNINLVLSFLWVTRLYLSDIILLTKRYIRKSKHAFLRGLYKQKSFSCKKHTAFSWAINIWSLFSPLVPSNTITNYWRTIKQFIHIFRLKICFHKKSWRRPCYHFVNYQWLSCNKNDSDKTVQIWQLILD